MERYIFWHFWSTFFCCVAFYSERKWCFSFPNQRSSGSRLPHLLCWASDMMRPHDALQLPLKPFWWFFKKKKFTQLFSSGALKALINIYMFLPAISLCLLSAPKGADVHLKWRRSETPALSPPACREAARQGRTDKNNFADRSISW